MSTIQASSLHTTYYGGCQGTAAANPLGRAVHDHIIVGTNVHASLKRPKLI
jgi:heptaprenylglyceryl phosphate synthase